MQFKYRQAGRKELVNCLYSLLPETKEIQHAKEQSQLCSEVHAHVRALILVGWPDLLYWVLKTCLVL